jgi:sugar phosphate isomerase/epimerase
MQLGIFAKTFAASEAMASLRAVSQAGYSVAQFNLACLGLPSLADSIAPQIARSVAKASQKTGVAVPAVSGTYNMIHPDIAVRETGLRRLAVLIASSRTMGANTVTLCTGTRDAQNLWRNHPENRSSEAWRDLRTEMSKAVALAEAHGVDLGVEPELANVVDCAEAARRMIEEIGSPRLRIVLDPANLAEVVSAEQRCAIVDRSIDILADRISFAHAKDRDAAGAFVAAGRGVIDFPHFIRGLRRIGFNGPLIAHGLHESEAPYVAKFLEGALCA